ncbi:MAG: hypothetical protein ACYCR5_11035, partial [Leptospirillum sp.]
SAEGSKPSSSGAQRGDVREIGQGQISAHSQKFVVHPSKKPSSTYVPFVTLSIHQGARKCAYLALQR